LKRKNKPVVTRNPIHKSGRRARIGEKALKEIRKLQKTVTALIPRAPFRRLVKQLIDEARTETGFRIKARAIEALQEVRDF